MKEELINKAYEIAKERYAAVGVDTEKVMETMQNFHLSPVSYTHLTSLAGMIVPWARPRAMAPPIFPAPIIATFILLKITREQEYIRHFCTTGELCLPVALRPGYETLYDRCLLYTSRCV